jgi:hypothetical protein
MTRVALGTVAALVLAYVSVLLVLVATRDSGTFVRLLLSSLLVPGAIFITAAAIRRRHNSSRG